MIASAEISLYPLLPAYEAPILDLIRRLRTHPGLRVHTNELSTQLTGDYDLLMHALHVELRLTFAQLPPSAVVIKLLNIGIEPGREVRV